MPAIVVNNIDSDASTYEGDLVTFVASRNLTITVQDRNTDPIENAQVGIYRISDRAALRNEDTTAAGIATQGYSGANADIEIRVRKSSPGDTRYVFFSTLGFVGSDNYSLLVTLVEDPNAT